LLIFNGSRTRTGKSCLKGKSKKRDIIPVSVDMNLFMLVLDIKKLLLIKKMRKQESK
jgi:hypothetical protein